METTEPNFSDARTLHFREPIDRKDEDIQSMRNGIFYPVYRVTTVKG
jgi:hypothetical protein